MSESRERAEGRSQDRWVCVFGLVLAALVPTWFIANMVGHGISQALWEGALPLVWFGGPAALAGAVLVAFDAPRSRWFGLVLILSTIAGPTAFLTRLEGHLHGGEIIPIGEAGFGIVGLLMFSIGMLCERRRSRASA